MILYLIRHGIAIDRDDPDCPDDPERQLTKEGARRVKLVAEGMRKLGADIDRWYSSPYRRARETAEIVAKSLDADVSAIIETPTLLPGSDPAAFLALLRKDKALAAAAFGHAPGLDNILSALLEKSVPVSSLKKAGVACVEIVQFQPMFATIRWLATPKLLTGLSRR